MCRLFFDFIYLLALLGLIEIEPTKPYEIKRGFVYLVSLNPTVGAKINKVRLAVVVSNDINNQYAETITVVPITSSRIDKVYPFEIFIPKGAANLDKDSKAKANQIRTIDKKHIVSKLGELPKDLMKKSEAAIKIHLDLE